MYVGNYTNIVNEDYKPWAKFVSYFSTIEDNIYIHTHKHVCIHVAFR